MERGSVTKLHFSLCELLLHGSPDKGGTSSKKEKLNRVHHHTETQRNCSEAWEGVQTANWEETELTKGVSHRCCLCLNVV